MLQFRIKRPVYLGIALASVMCLSNPAAAELRAKALSPPVSLAAPGALSPPVSQVATGELSPPVSRVTPGALSPPVSLAAPGHQVTPGALSPPASRPTPGALSPPVSREAMVRLDDSGKRATVLTDLAPFDSMMTHAADPRGALELLVLRERMRGWRFYDHFRSDAEAPARRPQVGTRTPVLSADGADLAAALQTIREIGDTSARPQLRQVLTAITRARDDELLRRPARET